MDTLFFKVFKNIVLFKKIFKFVRGEIRFDDYNLYYFNNRIKLSDINDLDWIVNRKQFEILKDILKNSNSRNNQYLRITGSSITSLIQECKYDSELLKLIYLVKKEYMELVNPFNLSISFNNYTLLNLLCTGEIKTSYKLSIDNITTSIGFGNVEIFKLLLNTLKSNNQKEFNKMMNHYNLLQYSISSENEGIIKYILDNIELLSGSGSGTAVQPLVKHTTFNQYSCLKDIDLKNRLLNLNIIDNFPLSLNQYKLPVSFKSLSIHHLKLIIREVNLITNNGKEQKQEEKDEEIEYYQSEIIGLFKLHTTTQECLLLFMEYFEMYNRFPITLSFNDIELFKQCSDGIIDLIFKFAFKNLNLSFLKYLVQINYCKEKQNEQISLIKKNNNKECGSGSGSGVDIKQLSENELIEFFEFYYNQKQVNIMDGNYKLSLFKQMILNENYSNSTIQSVFEKLSICIKQFEISFIKEIVKSISFSRYKWLIENNSLNNNVLDFGKFITKSIEFIDYFIENNKKELESSKYLQFDNVSLANYYQIKLNSKPTSQIYFYVYQKSIFNLDLSSVIEIDQIFKQYGDATTNEEEHDDNLFTLIVKQPNDQYELINLLNYLYDSGYQNFKHFIYNEAIVNFIFTIIFNSNLDEQNKYLSEININFTSQSTKTMVIELVIQFIFEKSSNINFIKFIIRNCCGNDLIMSIINSFDKQYISSLINNQHCLNNLEFNQKTLKSTKFKCQNIKSIIEYLLLELDCFRNNEITKPIFQKLYKLLLFSQDCSIFDIHDINLLYKKYGIGISDSTLFHCFYYLNLKSPKYTSYFINHSLEFKLKYLLDSFKSDDDEDDDEEEGIPNQFKKISIQLPFYKILNSNFNEIFPIIQVINYFNFSFEYPNFNSFVADFNYLFNQREFKLLLSNSIQFVSDINGFISKKYNNIVNGYFPRQSIVDLLMKINIQYNDDDGDDNSDQDNEEYQITNIILQIWQQLDTENGVSVYPLKTLLNLAFNNGSLYWTKFILLKLNKLNPTIEPVLKVNEYYSFGNLIGNNHFEILDFLYNNNYITTKYTTPN